MERSLLIASGKGGVGKSTAASRIGCILSEQPGHRVLLVDCDAGLASLDIMLDKTADIAFNWLDAYLGRCSTADAVIHSENGPDLLPAPSSAVPSFAADAVKKAVDELADNYDTVIIDAPAGVSSGFIMAAKAAKKAVIIATADEVSVKGAAAVARVAKEQGIEQCRLLINRYSIKAAKKGKLLTVDDIIDKTFIQLLGIIPEDPEITYSTVTGVIKENSKSTKAFRRIADRINGKNIRLNLSLLK